MTVSGNGAMADYGWNEQPWYSQQSNIQSVIIEDGVTIIGKHAFCEHTSLYTVTYYNSVTAILDAAFFGCSNLNKVNSNTVGECVIIDGLEWLGDMSFQDTLLEKVIILCTTPPECEGPDMFFMSQSSSYLPIYVSSDYVSVYEAADGWNNSEIFAIQEENTGVFVDIVLPTIFVVLVGTLACMYVMSARKQKQLVLR